MLWQIDNFLFSWSPWHRLALYRCIRVQINVSCHSIQGRLMTRKINNRIKLQIKMQAYTGCHSSSQLQWFYTTAAVQVRMLLLMFPCCLFAFCLHRNNPITVTCLIILIVNSDLVQNTAVVCKFRLYPGTHLGALRNAHAPSPFGGE